MTTPAILTKALLPVAGVSFHQDHVTTVAVGDDLIVQHDYSNPHDPWAVSVETASGNRLGYVSAKGGLARRLSENTPGGVWNATVQEVLHGDLTGLRIQLGNLIDQRDIVIGSDKKGHRDDADDPALATDAHASEPEDATHEDIWKVATITGRVLGTYLDTSDKGVRVLTDAGTTQTWPTTVVRIQRHAKN